MIYTYDKGFNDFTSKIDESTGYLEVNGTIARTGIQDYYGIELGEHFIKQYDLDPTKIYGVYRPKEEVLKQESLDTYINKSITDNHPAEFVNSKNENSLGKGSVSTISTYNKDGIDYVKGKLTIKDEKTIQKALAGKVELSPGYTQTLIKEKGEFQGKQYDFKQTDIKINHVALVDKGRCDGNCKITADKNSIISHSKKTNKGMSMKVTIDGVEHEITDCVGKHIGSLNSKITSLDEDMKKLEEEKKKTDEENGKLKGKNSKLEEDMEEEKKKTSDSTIDALVSEKVELIKTADTLKVEVKTSDSILDMKRAIIAGSSKIDLTDKTPEFIDGVYQTVVDSKITKVKAITDSQSSAFKEFDGKQQGISKFQDMAKEEL